MGHDRRGQAAGDVHEPTEECPDACRPDPVADEPPAADMDHAEDDARHRETDEQLEHAAEQQFLGEPGEYAHEQDLPDAHMFEERVYDDAAHVSQRIAGPGMA